MEPKDLVKWMSVAMGCLVILNGFLLATDVSKIAWGYIATFDIGPRPYGVIDHEAWSIFGGWFLLGIIIMACGFGGAMLSNKCCIGCFGCMSCCGCCAATVFLFCVSAPLGGFIISNNEDMNSAAQWFEWCNPKVCCDVHKDACPEGSAVPVEEYERQYLDCVLGADPHYTRHYENQVHMDSNNSHQCKWSVLYLTECKDQWGKDFQLYSAGWVDDLEKQINASLPHGSKLPPLPSLKQIVRDCPAHWENETIERIQSSCETPVKERMAKVNWREFAVAMEKVNFTDLQVEEFKVKEMFKSDLDNCTLKRNRLDEARDASGNALGLEADWDHALFMGNSWLVIFLMSSMAAVGSTVWFFRGGKEHTLLPSQETP